MSIGSGFTHPIQIRIPGFLPLARGPCDALCINDNKPPYGAGHRSDPIRFSGIFALCGTRPGYYFNCKLHSHEAYSAFNFPPHPHQLCFRHLITDGRTPAVLLIGEDEASKISITSSLIYRCCTSTGMSTLHT